MSDYTPTEAEVRRQIEDGSLSTGAIDGPAFDRFVASVKAEALREFADDIHIPGEVATALRRERYVVDEIRERALADADALVGEAREQGAGE